MIVAGIDPGKTGALFILCPAPYVLDVPTLKVKVAGKKALREVPDYDLWFKDWSVALAGVDHVYIERVSGSVMGHGREGKPQSGMFTFGQAVGFALGIVVASQRPWSWVTPQSWKKAVGIPTGAEKDQSRQRASQLMPHASHLWTRKKDVGRAEAALIACASQRR